jgi:hypothetical protein
MRGYNIAADTPHHGIAGVIAKVGVAIGQAHEQLRLDAMLGTVVEPCWHMRTTTGIERQTNLLAALELVVTYNLCVGVQNMNTLRSRLLDDA